MMPLRDNGARLSGRVAHGSLGPAAILADDDASDRCRLG